ncbi:hypothetical protein [Actinopolymorpha singaporensis]|uniref:Transmembrane protein n=1 Tax=Actinopolymorpha singaporensis TaxID=117157 RepID=A0A1H1TJZ2_9ACTN|nr:hypothetical protein [Actinopolymorpha singaporensis]SDS60494.1 hypothetical protein SAMN04489717_3230 [Actinopolymorpha singaporensis]
MTVDSDISPEGTDRQPRIHPLLLWFGVFGGVVAWFVQLFVGWGFEEVGCIRSGPAGTLLQHNGVPGTRVSLTVWTVTGVMWLVAVAALVTCLVLRRRAERLEDDVLTRGRVRFLLVLGIAFNLLSVAILTGSGIALLLLKPCS